MATKQGTTFSSSLDLDLTTWLVLTNWMSEEWSFFLAPVLRSGFSFLCHLEAKISKVLRNDETTDEEARPAPGTQKYSYWIIMWKRNKTWVKSLKFWIFLYRTVILNLCCPNRVANSYMWLFKLIQIKYFGSLGGVNKNTINICKTVRG